MSRASASAARPPSSSTTPRGRATPALRWFAQDEEVEALLVLATQTVFDNPPSDDAHRAAFLARRMKLARR